MSTPIPDARFSNPPTNGLLNDDTKIDLLFKNPGTGASSIGFKGLVDVFLQKGLTLNSPIGTDILYVGSWRNINVNGTITSGWYSDMSDNATPLQMYYSHPFSSSGFSLGDAVIDSTDKQNEWRWYTIISSYSSYGPNQPEDLLKSISIKMDTTDGAKPDVPLTLKTKAWFMYGKDAIDFAGVDPKIAGTSNSTTITPKIMILDKAHNMSENETVSGPNYPVTYTITATIASGVSLSNVIVTDNISNKMLLYDPDVTNASSVLGDFNQTIPSEFKGTVTKTISCVASRGNITIPSTSASQQFARWTIGSLTTIAKNIFTFTYKAYVPFKDITGALILDNTTTNITINETSTCTYTSSITGTSTNYTLTNTTNTLAVRRLCVQKTYTANGQLIPLQTVNYKLTIQVSDFFAFGSLMLDDVLSDGHYLSTAQQAYTSFIFKYKGVQYPFLSSEIVITDNASTIVNTVTSGSTIKNRYNVHMVLYSPIKKLNAILTYKQFTDGRCSGGLIKLGSSYADPYSGVTAYNYKNYNNGPMTFTIEYVATIDQIYYARTQGLTASDMNNTVSTNYNKLDIGDILNSNVTISGNLYNWVVTSCTISLYLLTFLFYFQFLFNIKSSKDLIISLD